MRLKKQLGFAAMFSFVTFAGCNLNLESVPDGGIVGSFDIFGQTFSFSLGDVGAIPVTANQPAEAIPVGFRLFDEAPASAPPSGVMRLPSANVGVGQLLSKAARQAKGLPLSGTGNIRFSVAAGQSASLCSSAVLLAEYDFTYNTGVVAVLQEEYEISSQALSVLVANDVTICVSITADFDALITLSGFDISFGGSSSSGSLTADFALANDDLFENIHILTPGEDFDAATNRLTPGTSRDVTLSVSNGETITLRAGRNGAVLDTATCPAVTGANYQADASWDGATLTCTATQSGSGSGSDDDDDTVPDGTIIQVPVDNAAGVAAIAPVTSTIGGVDYGVVGVLYDQTPLTPFAVVEPTTMSVDLSDLGLDSVSMIYMAVHSSFVPDLPNGVDMGTLTVSYAEGGAPTTLDFVLGSNTAEWSYDRPEHGTVPHNLATTLYTFSTEIDSEFEYDGREYAVSLSVDSSRTISCITLVLPSSATYSALRDPGDPEATFASQYVAAMTFEGPAGAPSIVGDCSGMSIPVGDCDADGECDPLCDPGDDPDCDPVGFGAVTGTVVNAQTGAALTGATVSILNSTLSTTTDATGQFTLEDVPAGSRTLVATLDNFAENSAPIVVPVDGTVEQSIGLLELNSGSSIVGVLSWGADPSDLDFHLSGPDNAGSRFHLYFSDRDPVPYACLDLDDTSSFGPETITISPLDTGDFVAGTYSFWVHNFSGDPEFGVSNASVTLFVGGVQINQFSVGGGGGDQDIWRIVEINVEVDGTVSAVNTIQSFADGNADSEF